MDESTSGNWSLTTIADGIGFLVAAKYYTHFLTGGAQAPGTAAAHEWSGVVELRQPLRISREMRELRSLLAMNFDLDSEDIRILHWARLH